MIPYNLDSPFLSQLSAILNVTNKEPSNPAPGNPSISPPRGNPYSKPPLLRPKRVRGGVRISAEEAEASKGWASQRWLRVVEQAAEGPRLVEGLEYARAGQTKRMAVASGLIDGLVQGRSPRAYVTQLRFETFTDVEWSKVIAAMSEGAIYAAKSLAGELPPNIEDVFVPLGLKLFPTEPSDVTPSCTCGDSVPWCKHACCLAHLFGAKLSSEPLLIFAIRGLDSEELRERLRERRAVAGATTGSIPVYAQRVPGASDIPNRPIEESEHQFWDVGPELAQLELPLAPPPVSHPLLRRLGQSPFQSAPFPLVGLLASCYEAISEASLRAEEPET